MKFIFAIALSFFLCSCSSVRSVFIPTDRTPLALPNPQPLVMKDVNFTIIHKDNAERVFSQMKSKGIEPILFGLSGDDYKALAYDMAEIKNYLILQKTMIELYRKYYREENGGKKED